MSTEFLLVATLLLFATLKTNNYVSATLAAAPVSHGGAIDDSKVFYESFNEDDDDYFVSRVELPRVSQLSPNEFTTLERFDMGLTIYNYSDSDVWQVRDQVIVPPLSSDAFSRLVVNELNINTGTSEDDSDIKHTTVSSLTKLDYSAKGCITSYVLDNEPMVTTTRLTNHFENVNLNMTWTV